MFGLFRSAPFSDPSLGTLVRSRGLWRGTVHLDSRATPIAVAGPRSAPDPVALAAAREVQGRMANWRPAIEAALFDHYEPYAEASVAGSDAVEGVGALRIDSPADVWAHASLEFVSVLPMNGTIVTELGYATAWDEEHTLGVRFADGAFVELCASVLPP